MSGDASSTFLVVLCGTCWTIVYLDGIRLGFKDRTYAMPFWALALNIAWEVLHSVLGYHLSGLALQTIINGIWALLDIGILYTYFRFGRKWFPASLRGGWFFLWSLLGLISAAIIQYAFAAQFGVLVGRAYGAFLSNLLMSVLFIGMLVQRESSEGQSLTIAVSKWLGTLAPTILFGVVGTDEFAGPSSFILTIGLLCCVFDLVYLAMLSDMRARERHFAAEKSAFWRLDMRPQPVPMDRPPRGQPA